MRPTSSTPSIKTLGAFDADEIRLLVQRGRNAGLLRGATDATPVRKDGAPVAAEGALRSQWMDVSPELAKTWLENNFRNRPVADDVVTAYARDMVNGVWIATHQGVAFNDKDELIDGQHRLLAVIMAGKTVRMMVTFGLPSKIAGSEMTTMDAVDRGRTRSVSDQLKIQHGLKDAAITAGICSQLANICAGTRTRRLSVGQTLEIYRAFEDAVRWVIIHRSTAPGLRAAGVCAGFAFALVTEEGFFGGGTPIARMHERLMLGDKERRSRSALTLLHEFLTSEDAKLLSRGNDRALAELVLQAIHLELVGEPVSKLELGTAGVDRFRSEQLLRVEKVAAMFKLPAAGAKK